MSQLPEYQEQEFCPPACPTVEQRLERTVRQYDEATVADIVRRLGETQDSDTFICPFCKGYFATPTALSSCNHSSSSPLSTQRRPNGNTTDYPRHGSISTPIGNSHHLDDVLRTMSPGMRQYVVFLEEAYQKKMRGTDENALQNLQQRMMSMANSQPESPHFAWNSATPPSPATSAMADNIIDVSRVPSAVSWNNRAQTQVKSTRSNPPPKKSGGMWAAMRRK